jgi:hypothetical protein
LYKLSDYGVDTGGEATTGDDGRDHILGVKVKGFSRPGAHKGHRQLRHGRFVGCIDDNTLENRLVIGNEEGVTDAVLILQRVYLSSRCFRTPILDFAELVQIIFILVSIFLGRKKCVMAMRRQMG